MSIKKLTMTITLGTLMAAASAGVMASDRVFDEAGAVWNNNTAKSTLTRAQVNNEVIKARLDGTLPMGEASIPALKAVTVASTSRSRAEVRSEAIQQAQNNTRSSFYRGS